MEQQVEKIAKQVGNLEQQVEKILTIVLKTNETQEEMKKDMQEMKTRQDRMEERQDKMEETQKQMQEELTRIGNTVAVIEHEHGRKIDLILEVLTGHTEKLEEHDKEFEKGGKILQMHDNKIAILDRRTQN